MQSRATPPLGKPSAREKYSCGGWCELLNCGHDVFCWPAPLDAVTIPADQQALELTVSAAFPDAIEAALEQQQHQQGSAAACDPLTCRAASGNQWV